MKTILFIDDNEVLQSVYKDAFKRLGYHTIPAYTGAAGLNLLEDIIPDLVLLDIMMEPMDGWMVLEKIRKNQDTNTVPIIVMTAKSLHPLEIIQYGEMIDGYITKPLQLKDIKVLLEKFWDEQESVEKIITNARSRGILDETLAEYRILRNQTQVIAKMLSYIENMLGISGREVICDELLDPELNTIRNMLAEKNERYHIIQQQVE